jgi:hypothetical protein
MMARSYFQSAKVATQGRAKSVYASMGTSLAVSASQSAPHAEAGSVKVASGKDATSADCQCAMLV